MNKEVITLLYNSTSADTINTHASNTDLQGQNHTQYPSDKVWNGT